MHPAWLDGLAGLDRDPAFAPLLFQTPVRRLAVEIADAPRLATPPPADERVPFALVAKLGAKSWRDGGSLRVIGADRPLARDLATLLHGITAHQARYLDLVRPHVAHLDLSLFRYVDFSVISEARWRAQAERAWRTSQCRRAMPIAVLNDSQHRMQQIALKVRARLERDVIVDCTIERSGHVRVLEINPIPSHS